MCKFKTQSENDMFLVRFEIGGFRFRVVMEHIRHISDIYN